MEQIIQLVSLKLQLIKMVYQIFLHELREKVFDRADIFTVAEADGVYPSDFDKWIGENGAFDMSFDFSHIRLGFDEDCTWHKRKIMGN